MPESLQELKEMLQELEEKDSYLITAEQELAKAILEEEIDHRIAHTLSLREMRRMYS